MLEKPFRKWLGLSLFRKDVHEGAEHIFSDKLFQIAGASKARVLLKCFFNLCSGGQYWAVVRNPPIRLRSHIVLYCHVNKLIVHPEVKLIENIYTNTQIIYVELDIVAICYMVW